VQALQRQVAKHAPFATFDCLSDVPEVSTIQLKMGWPGWWSKLELFRPDINGDFLYMDLDTVLVGDLNDILAVDKLTMLLDFYRTGKKYNANLVKPLRQGLNSGLMFLPEKARAVVWDDFIQRPKDHMDYHRRGGDQVFLEKHYTGKAQRWQDVLPGQVVSYKVHCAQEALGKGPVFRGIPRDARIICFHGQPRPWAVKEFKDLYT